MSGERRLLDDGLVAGYVRSRADVEPPPTFVDEVMRAVSDLPQQRASFFSSLALPLAAATAVALILVVAALIASPPQVGPELGEDEPTPTPRPTLTPADELSLTEVGDVVRIPAIDADGVYGTITIERGEEVAGYEGAHDPLAFDAFFVHLYISYELDRPSTAPHGWNDWGYRILGDFMGVDASRDTWSGPFAGETTPTPALPHVPNSSVADIEGWLILPIWADAADSPITLVYGCPAPDSPEQDGSPEALGCRHDPDGQPDEDPAYAVIPVREPGPPVGTSPAWTPPPGFEPPALAVEPHAGAEALFAETASCTNADAGYTLAYPATWFADAACTRFSPTPLDETATAGATITIESHEGGEPDFGEVQPIPLGGNGTVDGVEVVFFHFEAVGEAMVPAGERFTVYLALPGGAPVPGTDFPWLQGVTTTVQAADDAEYELNRAVLARIVASLDFPE